MPETPLTHPRYYNGLQTRGVFCCACTAYSDRVEVGEMWLESLDRLGAEVSLKASEGEDRLLPVRLPKPGTPQPFKNLTLYYTTQESVNP